MTQSQYRVLLEKEEHVFSAAHFITFNGSICESLHGHNYRVRCEVCGPLDENGYVVDFVALTEELTKIIRRLDHRTLLPTQHPQIGLAADSREVTATFESKRWIFPLEDCVLLPIANTTAELLAEYIGKELIAACSQQWRNQINTVIISVDENHGQWGIVELPITIN